MRYENLRFAPKPAKSLGMYDPVAVMLKAGPVRVFGFVILPAVAFRAFYRIGSQIVFFPPLDFLTLYQHSVNYYGKSCLNKLTYL
jgi:hypothetical protein